LLSAEGKAALPIANEVMDKCRDGTKNTV